MRLQGGQSRRSPVLTVLPILMAMLLSNFALFHRYHRQNHQQVGTTMEAAHLPVFASQAERTRRTIGAADGSKERPQNNDKYEARRSAYTSTANDNNNPNRQEATSAKAAQLEAPESNKEQEKQRVLRKRFETLPDWMQSYFQWHHETRSRLMTNQTLQQAWIDRIQNQRKQLAASQKSKQQVTAVTAVDGYFPKLLILQCLQSNRKCGGTADRLKPIPFLLYAAARKCQPEPCLFLIRWTRPYPLQEFLVPPAAAAADDAPYYSLDWRVPDWMEEQFLPANSGEDYYGFRRRHINNVDQVLPRTASATNDELITMLIQWHDGGQLIYDAQPENQPATVDTTKQNNQTSSTAKINVAISEFRRIYHDLFRLLLEPSRPIAQQIERLQKETGLVPGEYVVAQYRAFYRERETPPTVEYQRSTGVNAANCASQLRQQQTNRSKTGDLGPVYFASDSKHAVEAVREYAQNEHHPIVTLEQDVELLHLDRDPNEQNASKAAVHDYYPIFVDLFFMGNGRCISFGEGGFARFGLILSYNYTCESRHWWRRKIIPCQWTGGD